MTRAIRIEAPGGPDALVEGDVQLADPRPDEIRVAHEAVGVNFIDVYQRKGLYPLAMPAVLGSEAAGRVEAAGADSGFSVGDRVAYIASAGGYAQANVIPAALAARLPDAIEAEIAAAVFLKGLTARMLVNDVFALGPGHACLIYAAAGGVGGLLTQWAAGLGAQVVAVVGAAEKAEIARRFGADHVIIRDGAPIAAQVRAATEGRGVDVAYDSVGAATFESSLDSLAIRGHLVSYGNASGPPPAIQPLELSRRGSLTLTRPSLFHYATPDRLPAMAKSLFDEIAAGRVTPDIRHRFPLAKAGEAHRLLESGDSMGAIVLTP